MANQCCACKRKIGIFDTAAPIISSVPEFVLCEDCNRLHLNMRGVVSKEKYQEYEKHFEPMLNERGTPAAIRTHFVELRGKWEEKVQKKAEKDAQAAEEEKKRMEAAQQEAAAKQTMTVVTTERVEGKRVKHYLDVVTGTSIYLVGGLIGGGLANQENLFGYAFAEARQNMVNKAAAKGANAVIGVSTNVLSPGGLNNIIVVVTGTAVVLEDA